ncbi:MAG: D-alanine--D-alanine ligase [Syntrophomonadaceae bacterium]|nr:D-alanine--D-alanine ligase [Syntrophomonadaceae bacterium]
MEKVLVLMGGTSAEREVSLRSGNSVAKALLEAGYYVDMLDFKGDNINEIIGYSPDVVFIALHGENGEDGRIQGYLDILGIPYTSSGLTASAIGMNKILTKKMLLLDDIPTAKFYIIKKADFALNSAKEIKRLIDKLDFPLVIKAPSQGSSIGTYIVKDKNSLITAINDGFNYDSELLAEQYITGVEITAAVIGNDKLEVLPLIEITSTNEFYDYESKYTKGKCEHIIPARIDDKVMNKVNSLTERIYKLLGCKGFARVDFIIGRDNIPYVLEINTVPGMTDMSLVPDAAKAKGISYIELCDRIVKLALK